MTIYYVGFESGETIPYSKTVSNPSSSYRNPWARCYSASYMTIFDLEIPDIDIIWFKVTARIISSQSMQLSLFKAIEDTTKFIEINLASSSGGSIKILDSVVGNVPALDSSLMDLVCKVSVFSDQVEIVIWKNNETIVENTFSYVGNYKLNRISAYNQSTAVSTSEVILADESLLNTRVLTINPTADSTQSGFSGGDYSTVGKISPDESGISADNSGAEFNVNSTVDPEIYVTEEIVGIGVSAVGSAVGVDSDIHLNVNGEKIGDTKELKATDSTQLIQSIATINPDTGLPFTANDLALISYGVVVE